MSNAFEMQFPTDEPEPDESEGLRLLLGQHADKLITAAEAALKIKSGDHVFVGTACATPRSLVAALEALPKWPADVELLHFLTDHAVPHNADGQATTHFQHRTFFVGQDMLAAVRQGKAHYVPMSIARVPEMMAKGRIAVDVALIQVSLPDEFGYVNLGVSVDVVAAAVNTAKLVIAEVNPAMPRAMGDANLHISRLHFLVAVDTPVIEYVHQAPAEAMAQIARYIGTIIEDGATLQIGLGRVTNEALKHLVDRQDIGIHSDVITDAIIPLIERGVLTGKRKTQQAHKIVCSFAMGTQRLYDLIDRNPLFSFQPIEVVCDEEVIAAQHKMVSVTQAFAIDLTGQVCADQFHGNFYGGLAAQGEFLRGAARSQGGKPIICLQSSDDATATATANTSDVDLAASRIRAVLQPGEGVTVARTDVHYVITEYGIAYLFGKSIAERAVALIAVAHPKFRAALMEQAKVLGYVAPDQALKNMRAYAADEEKTVLLKDQRSVLLRPATSVDGVAIRQLFHQLSDSDVYTRFFRKVRGLSNKEVQRLCNLNFEDEVAFVAATGSRESPVVVAQACYFVNPSTNLAETAFMVHPDWQGCGLASAMQHAMKTHAMARGVSGFVAEILSSNTNMIRLARNASSDVSTQSKDGTVYVTSRF